MVSLPTSPVELRHQIFSELDGTILFLSVRDVCRQFRAVVDTHYRCTFNLTSISKPDFHRLLRVIHPENVTGLTLCDRGRTPGQVGLLLSLVDIHLFTRIRSLTLLDTDEQRLCSFLQYASKCSLTSLILHSSIDYFMELKQILEHLSSIIEQPSLRHLELRDATLSKMIDQCQWSVQCKLRYLRIVVDQQNLVPRMIDRSPDLETLVLDYKSALLRRSNYIPEGWLSASCPRLTSLTLSNCPLQIDDFQRLLSQTPSLRHLKLIHPSRDLINGSRWEDLIKTKLLFLNKFEFYARFSCRGLDEENPESVSNELMVSFRTPF